MARELVTHIWCDPCLQPGEGEEQQYTKGEEMPPITLGSMKPRMLALCERHRKEMYEPFKDLVAQLGQVVPDSGSGSTSTRTHTPGSYACPVPDCPKHRKPFKHDTSLGKHCREVHDRTYGELRQQYGDPQGALLHSEGLLSGEPVVQPDAPGKPPSETRAECDVCGKVFEWPRNPRPTQALGVHRSRSHGIKGEGRKDRQSA